MKRTTITVPEQTLARLEREARRRHTSVSAIVRECIGARFPGTEYEQGPRHIAFAGIGESTDGLNAADTDDYLAEHWPAWIESHRG
jgi:Ribbon-helix-helix protein, copG family